MTDMLGPYLLGPNDTPENGIYTGDARELAKAIPDESVDLIFTDPVYDRIDDYRWLAETGARVLRQDRACLVWHAQKQIGDVLVTVKPHLRFVWQIALYRPALNTFGGGGMFSCWHSLLLLGRGTPRARKHTRDYLIDGNPARIHGHHKWHKQSGPYRYYTEAFSELGMLIFDPFTGGGTVPAVCKMLGRRYLAFEIDPDVAQMARERVRQTQPPLFVPHPTQQELAL
jgi:hypothetical protein